MNTDEKTKATAMLLIIISFVSAISGVTFLARTSGENTDNLSINDGNGENTDDIIDPGNTNVQSSTAGLITNQNFDTIPDHLGSNNIALFKSQTGYDLSYTYHAGSSFETYTKYGDKGLIFYTDNSRIGIKIPQIAGDPNYRKRMLIDLDFRLGMGRTVYGGGPDEYSMMPTWPNTSPHYKTSGKYQEQLFLDTNNIALGIQLEDKNMTNTIGETAKINYNLKLLGIDDDPSVGSGSMFFPYGGFGEYMKVLGAAMNNKIAPRSTDYPYHYHNPYKYFVDRINYNMELTVEWNPSSKKLKVSWNALGLENNRYDLLSHVYYDIFVRRDMVINTSVRSTVDSNYVQTIMPNKIVGGTSNGYGQDLWLSVDPGWDRTQDSRELATAATLSGIESTGRITTYIDMFAADMDKGTWWVYVVPGIVPFGYFTEWAGQTGIVITGNPVTAAYPTTKTPIIRNLGDPLMPSLLQFFFSDDFFFVMPTIDTFEGNKFSNYTAESWTPTIGPHHLTVAIDPIVYKVLVISIDGRNVMWVPYTNTQFCADVIWIGPGPLGNYFNHQKAIDYPNNYIMIDNIVAFFTDRPVVSQVSIDGSKKSGETVSGKDVRYIFDNQPFISPSITMKDVSVYGLLWAPILTVRILDGQTGAPLSEWPNSYDFKITQVLQYGNWGTGSSRYDGKIQIPDTATIGKLYKIQASYTNSWGETDTNSTYFRFFKISPTELSPNPVLNLGTVKFKVIAFKTYDAKMDPTVLFLPSNAKYKFYYNDHSYPSSGLTPVVLIQSYDAQKQMSVWYFDVSIDVHDWGILPYSFIYLDMTFDLKVKQGGIDRLTYPFALSTYYTSLNFVKGINIKIFDASGNILPNGASITESIMSQYGGIKVFAEVNDPYGSELGKKMFIVMQDHLGYMVTDEMVNLPGSSTFQYVIATSRFNDDIHEGQDGFITCYTSDSAGGAISLSNMMMVKLDYATPEFTVDGPLDGATYYGFSIPYVITSSIDTYASLDHVDVSIINIGTEEKVYERLNQKITTNPTTTDFLIDPTNSRKFTWLKGPASLAQGSYRIDITMVDKCLFSKMVSSTFTVDSYSPNVMAKLIVPKEASLQSRTSIKNGKMNLTMSIDTLGDTVKVTSISYKVIENGLVYVAYGDTKGGTFPTNPIWTGNSRKVSFVEANSTKFNVNLFKTATYAIEIRVDVLIGGTTSKSYFYSTTISEKEGGTITNSVDTVFMVSQLIPQIFYDEDGPHPYNFDTNTGYTYVTESQVTFSGEIIDYNKDIDSSSLTITISDIGTDISLTPYITAVPYGYTFSYPVDINSFTSSINEVTVKAKDAKMSLPTSSSRSFRVDTASPDISNFMVNESSTSVEFNKDNEHIEVAATISSPFGISDASLTIFISDSNVGWLEVYSYTFTTGEIGAGSDLSHELHVSDLGVTESTDVANSRKEFKVEWTATGLNGKSSSNDIATRLVVDKVLPVMQVISDTKIDQNPSSILVSASSSTSSIVEPIKFTIEGTTVVDRNAVLYSGNLYSLDFLMEELPNDVNDFIVTVTAVSSNTWDNKYSFQISISRISPSVNLVEPTLNEAEKVLVSASVDSVDVRCLPTDENGDIETVEWRSQHVELGQLMTASLTPMNLQYGEYIETIDLTGFYGLWMVEIVVTDKTGLVATKSFSILRASPITSASFIIISPTEGKSVSGSTLHLECEITYGVEIVQSMEYYIPNVGGSWEFMNKVDQGGKTYFEADADMATLPPGTHLIKFRLFGSGSFEQEKSSSFYKIPTVVTIVDPPVLSLGIIEGHNITIYWSEVETATAYQVYKSTSNITSVTDATLISTINDLEYMDMVENKSNDTTYYYVVVAVIPGGITDISNVVSTTIKGNTQPAPPSIFEQIISTIVGFIMLIISLITGLFSLAIIRSRGRNAASGINTSISCLVNPKSDNCSLKSPSFKSRSKRDFDGGIDSIGVDSCEL